ncbi:Ig-like domain-containing protein [Sphingomonas sp. BIUV-7]|uniref:Ig-like domain-containing protein n=1 Tax=Sphingomonas natans TaxID=3063330 RepID=A0ABT8Y9T2_9SPHN|nr:Ig-like domain-containing protein [Sphingomonas sp. BIUV-7]MDO6415097.1 Ig-like domain-containing protein [Sphingomonas sp. BIUV-7]
MIWLLAAASALLPVASRANTPCAVGPAALPGLRFTNAGDGSFQLVGVLTGANLSAFGPCSPLPRTTIRPLVNGTATATPGVEVPNATQQGGTLVRATVTEINYRPPSPGFSGSDTFTIDNNNTSQVITVTVFVDPAAASAPVVSSLSPTSGPAAGNTSVTIGGTGFTGATTVRFGATAATGFTVNSATSIVATAPAGTGSVNITVTTPAGTSIIGGGSGYTYIAAPTAGATSASVPYNMATAIDLSGSITGVHSSIAVASAPAHGTTSVSGDVVSYTPTSGYSGPDSFTYTATGSGGTSAPATISITVAPPPAPAASAQSASVPYGTATAIDLSGSITGVHSSVAISSGPAHGMTSVSGDVITYTPTSGYFGADSFSYTATGPGGTSAPATVSVTVAAPAAPTAAARSVSAAHNTATAIDLSGSISGVHTGTAVVGSPAHGTTSVSGDIVTYTPANGYIGADSFTYNATGPGGTSSAATVSITVAAPAAPVTAAQSVAVPYHTATAIDLSGSVTGVHSGIALAGGPTHGSAGISGDVVTYTPGSGYSGLDSFTYTATGPGGTSAPATVSITVAAPPAPVAGARSASVPYDTPVAIDLSGSITGMHASIAVAGTAAHGTTSLAGDVVTYAPASGYYGADSFTYTATGPGGTSAAATVSITVAAPGAPTVAARSVSVPYESATPVDLSASISGVHSSIAIASGPAHGSTSVSGDVVTYTPSPGYSGADGFSYSATGPGGTSTPAVVTIAIAAPAAPVAAAKSVSVPYGAASQIDLSESVTGAHSGLVIAGAPSHGTATVSGDVVTYMPATGYHGPDAVTYVATGPGGTSAPASISITVADPAAPVAVPSSASVPYRSTGTIDLSTSITGVHSSIGIASAPSHGTATLSGDVITYVASPSFSGTDSLTFTATGPGGTSAPAIVTITVATPDSPTASGPAAVSAVYGAATTIDLSGSITGVHTSIAVTTPAHGTVGVAGDVVTYTPAAGYFGPDSFAFAVTGPGGVSSPETVNLTVAAPATPVVSAPAGVTAAYEAPTVIDLSGSVTGVHSAIAIVAAPAHGAASVSGDVVTYTPVAGYFGADSLSYAATGPGGTSPPQVIALTIAAPSAPIVAAKADVAVGYGTPLAIDLSSLISGVHSATSVSLAPAHGTASVAGDVVTYTPAAGYSGLDSFAFTATGPGGTASAQTIGLTVGAPVMTIAGEPLPGGQINTAYAAAVSASGGTAPYSYAVTSGTLPAGVTLSPTGALTGTPTASGDFAVSVTATDSSTGSGPFTAVKSYVLAIAAPQPPQAQDAPASAVTASTVTSSTSIDIDLSALVTGAYDDVRVDTPPQHGNVVVNRVGQQRLLALGEKKPLASTSFVATYTAAAGYKGADAFTFVAIGPGGTSRPAAVAIDVVGAAPTARSVTAATVNGQAAIVDLTTGAGEGPFTASTIASITPAGSVSAILVEGGTATARTYQMRITPLGRFSGTAVIGYTLSNIFGTSAVATVTVTVTARPDPSQDPAVRALSLAQAEATRRFAATQIDIFSRRTEQLHGGGRGSQHGTMGIRVNGSDRPASTAGLTTDSTSGIVQIDDGGQPALSTTAASGAPAEATDDGNRAIGSAAVWSGGAIMIGTRDATTRRDRFSVSSSGLSAGIDVKLTDRLIVGAGGGYGGERSRIAEGAAHLTADSWMGSLYGSFQPARGAFLDGVLGIGGLDFATRRAVSANAATARGQRDGSMVFASLAAGIDRSSDRTSFSAFARAEYMSARLGAYSEEGAGMYDLAFGRRSLESLSSVLGVRAGMTLGAIMPRVRFEWRHEFSGSGAQALDYADLAGLSYAITNDRWLRDAIQLEAGTGVNLGGDWTLGLDIGAALGRGSRLGSGKVSVGGKF